MNYSSNNHSDPAYVVPLRTFNGADDADPMKRLRALDNIQICDRAVPHSPEQLRKCIRLVDRLLEGPAARWVDIHPVIRDIIRKKHSELYLVTEEYINGLYDLSLRRRVRVNGRVTDNKYSRRLLTVHVLKLCMDGKQ